MTARIRAIAALAALPIVLAGCEGCEWQRDPVGTPRISPGEVVGGQEVRVDVGGVGWQGTHVCPKIAELRLSQGATPVATAPVESVTQGSACVATDGAPLTFRAPTRGEGTLYVEVTLAAEMAGPVASVRFIAQHVLTVTLRQTPAAAPPPSPPTTPPPVADFTVTPAAPGTNHAITLDGTASARSGTVAAYRWDANGDGTFDAAEPSGPTTELNYAQPGTRTVGLRVQDALGRTASTTRTFTVHEEAGPDAAFTLTPQEPEAGEAARFDASATTDPDGDAIAAYHWDFGDGTTETTAGPVIDHAFAAAGDYDVSLTADDARGLSSAPATMTVGVAAARRAARAAASRRKAPSAITGPFKLELQGRLLSSGVVSRRGGALRARNALGGGAAVASLPKKLARRAPAGLRRFRTGRWAGRFDAAFPGLTQDVTKVRGSGYVLVRSTKYPSTTVCLKVTGDMRRAKLTRFTVVGGTGPARKLVAIGGGARDTITARTARRARGLPRQCVTLRRVLARVR